MLQKGPESGFEAYCKTVSKRRIASKGVSFGLFILLPSEKECYVVFYAPSRVTCIASPAAGRGRADTSDELNSQQLA